MTQVNAAVTIIHECGGIDCHHLSYEEGYPETIAETLLDMMGQEDFVGIKGVLVDIQGDYSDLNALGRKSRRVTDEVIKLRDTQARIYHGENGDDSEEHF